MKIELNGKNFLIKKLVNVAWYNEYFYLFHDGMQIINTLEGEYVISAIQ